MDIKEIKRRLCEAVDNNAEKIIALGESIFAEPEMGFKEVKTAAKVKKVLDDLGVAYQDGVAITGVVAPLKGRNSNVRLALMGELDAIIAPGHRCADPEAGADAVGAEVKIVDIPGYMTPYECPEMKAIVEQNLADIYGAENVVPGMGYTTEANDVAHLIPTVHCTIGGAEGIAHSSNYEIADKDSAYIKATKMLLCSAVDLLANGAEKGLSVKKNFQAPMTKEQYLREWGKLKL